MSTHISTAPESACSFFDVRTESGGVHVCKACGETMPPSWAVRMQQAIGVRRFRRLNTHRMHMHAEQVKRERDLDRR